MTTRYAALARDYLDAGFTPIPVHHKLPPMSGVTGTKRSVTSDDVSLWVANPDPFYDNLAIRHEQTLAIDVDDEYGGKNGAAQLAGLAERVGLPDLPPTYSTTARGDQSPSRQYLYRVPEGVTVAATTRLRSKPCGAVELCYRNHRYTVAYPSVHPKTGSVYRWYEPGDAGAPPTWGGVARIPCVDQLATIPSEWWSHLYQVRGYENPRAHLVEVKPENELLDTFRPAMRVEADVLRRERLRYEELDHVGHDDFFARGARILEFGIQGVPGAKESYLDLKARANAYLKDEGRPDDELPRMVEEIVSRVQKNIQRVECYSMTANGVTRFRPVWGGSK